MKPQQLKYLGSQVIKLTGVGELQPGQEFELENWKARQLLTNEPELYAVIPTAQLDKPADKPAGGKQRG